MTWAKLETAAVARSLSAVAAEPGDLAEVYFERRVDAEWPPDESRCGLRIRREEGLAVRLVRGEHTWLASRDRITGSELVSALRQVARTQPATMLEPELEVGPPPAVPTVPIAALRGFAPELERAIRRHHVAFPFRLTARWHRRDLQVVGPRWVPESESETFFSLDIDLPWGRCGALTTALQAGDAERIARALVARFRAREASPPPSGRYPLLLAPAATAVLLHEAVGHALEADLLPVGEADVDRGDLRGLRGLRDLRDLRDLRRSALVGDPRTGNAATAETRPALDILDDPQRAPRGVTRSTDDEGQPVQRRWLIRSGRVEQPIADGLHALRSGRWLPGSGFRAGRHDAPLPRMHHLELLPGSAEASELARSALGSDTAGTGLLVSELDQGALDPLSGEVVLHAPCGRYIRGGELAEPCGPLTLRCHVGEILSAVVAVGNDSVTAGAGWCAKDGQRRAVWATAPSIALAPLAVTGGRSERCP